LVAHEIRREIVIDAPVDVVWAVVTEPEHIAGWFSDGVELELRPGGRMALRWERYGVVRGRVERVEPPHVFSFRWVVPREPGAEVAERNATLVEFTLSPEGASTRLTVVESGFDALDGREEDREGWVDGHRSGWEIELGELAEYVAR
jgi:uncharacterized protein YndB with AHSA1/START domain